MSITVTVLYPREEEKTFDFDYYRDRHMPLVAEKWGDAGMEGAEALRGLGAPDGSAAPFFAIAVIRFRSLDAFQAAANSEAGREVLGDIRNFTDVRPLVQINELLG